MARTKTIPQKAVPEEGSGDKHVTKQNGNTESEKEKKTKCSKTSLIPGTSKRGAKPRSEKLDRELWAWYCVLLKRGIPVSRKLVVARALWSFHQMGFTDFRATDCWYQRWLKCWKYKGPLVGISETGPLSKEEEEILKRLNEKIQKRKAEANQQSSQEVSKSSQHNCQDVLKSKVSSCPDVPKSNQRSCQDEHKGNSASKVNPHNLQESSNPNQDAQGVWKPNSHNTSKSNQSCLNESKSTFEETTKLGHNSYETLNPYQNSYDTSKPRKSPIDTSKSLQNFQDTSKSNLNSHDTSKSQSNSYDTSKSHSNSYDTSKSHSNSHDISKSHSNSYGTSKSHSNSYDTSKSHSNSYDTSKSHSNSYATSKTPQSSYDTIKSHSNSEDTSKSLQNSYVLLKPNLNSLEGSKYRHDGPLVENSALEGLAEGSLKKQLQSSYIYETKCTSPVTKKRPHSADLMPKTKFLKKHASFAPSKDAVAFSLPKVVENNDPPLNIVSFEDLMPPAPLKIEDNSILVTNSKDLFHCMKYEVNIADKGNFQFTDGSNDLLHSEKTEAGLASHTDLMQEEGLKLPKALVEKNAKEVCLSNGLISVDAESSVFKKNGALIDEDRVSSLRYTLDGTLLAPKMSSNEFVIQTPCPSNLKTDSSLNGSYTTVGIDSQYGKGVLGDGEISLSQEEARRNCVSGEVYYNLNSTTDDMNLYNDVMGGGLFPNSSSQRLSNGETVDKLILQDTSLYTAKPTTDYLCDEALSDFNLGGAVYQVDTNLTSNSGPSVNFLSGEDDVELPSSHLYTIQDETLDIPLNLLLEDSISLPIPLLEDGGMDYMDFDSMSITTFPESPPPSVTVPSTINSNMKYTSLYTLPVSQESTAPSKAIPCCDTQTRIPTNDAPTFLVPGSSQDSRRPSLLPVSNAISKPPDTESGKTTWVTLNSMAPIQNEVDLRLSSLPSDYLKVLEAYSFSEKCPQLLLATTSLDALNGLSSASSSPKKIRPKSSKSSQTSVESPKKKRAKYPEELKKEVVEFAKSNTIDAAAKKYHIHGATVSDWARAHKAVNKTKKEESNAEVILLAWLRECRERMETMTAEKLKNKVKSILQCFQNSEKTCRWLVTWAERLECNNSPYIEGEIEGRDPCTMKRERHLGYPPAFKLEVLKYVEKQTLMSVATVFNLSRRRILEWVYHKEEFSRMEKPRIRRTGGGRKFADEDLNQKVWQWYQKCLENDIRPLSQELTTKAIEISKEKGLVSFKASQGWINKWCKLYGVKLRHGDDDAIVTWVLCQMDKSLPLSRESLVEEAVEIIRRLKPDFKGSPGWVARFLKRYPGLMRKGGPGIDFKIPSSLQENLDKYRQRLIKISSCQTIMAMDEVLLDFSTKFGFTVQDSKISASKSTKNKSIGWVIVACSSDGTLFPPFLVLRGRQHNSNMHFINKQVKTWVEESGEVTPAALVAWITCICKNAEYNTLWSNVLVMDCFAPHSHCDVISALTSADPVSVQAELLPAGTGFRGNPVNLGVSSTLASLMQQQWKKALRAVQKGVESLSMQQKLQVPTPDEIIKWLVECWQQMQNEDMKERIRRAFVVAGLKNGTRSGLVDNESWLESGDTQ